MCILRFYELVVKINVVHLSFLEISHLEQGTYQQGVECVCRVKVVGLARWGRIGDVSTVSSLIALRMVSALQIRSVGCRERCFMRCVVTSSIHDPPQKYTLMSERMISLYWYPKVLLRMPSVESITDDSLESNCSIIENIPPKGVSFADFMLIFAMPLMNFICYILQH